MTIALIVANLGIFMAILSPDIREFEAVIRRFGLVPARDGYSPAHMLTSMFLHGGFFHVFSNLWTLWIFGDNIEDRMGASRFLIFYLVCGMAAAVTHVFVHPESALPVVGASGAIAGVLGAYFVMYPRAQVVCIVPILFYPLFVELPAFIFGLIWFGSQILSATAVGSIPGGGVAWWAHTGGFVSGVVLHRLFLSRQPRRQLYSDEFGLMGPWRR